MSHYRDISAPTNSQNDTPGASLALPFLDSPQIFQLASRLTGIIAWEANLSTGEIVWSGDAGRILPDEPPESYQGLLELIHPEDRNQAHNTLEAWMQDGGEFTIEFRFRNLETGHTVWVRCNGTTLRDDVNGQAHHVGIAQDITGFKQQEGHAALLTETQLVLETTTSTQSALATIAEMVVEHLGLSRFAIGYISPTSETSTLLHEHLHEGHQGIPFSRVSDISSFLSPGLRETLARGQTVAISDVQEDDRHAAHLDRYARHSERAELMIPYRTEGQWAILLSVFKDTPHVWEQHEIDLLTEIMERLSPRLEQSRVSQGFRKSEDRYRTLFESIDDGFCIIEMIFDDSGNPIDYRFLEVNPAFERHTGLQDAAGRRMRELVPNHEDHWFDIYGNVALTGEPIRFTQVANALEGRWFDLYALPIGDPEHYQIAVVFHDMTAERRAEQAIRESEARLRKLTEIETVGIVFFQQDLRITDTNDAFLNMCGYSHQDVAGGNLSIATITPPEWKPESLHATDDLFVHEHMEPYEREFLRKDGSRMWGLVAGARIGENEAVKFVIDISDAKQIEQDQGRLAAIVESSADAIVRCEPDGTIVDANHAATTLYRLPGEQLIGRNITEFAPDDRQHEFADRFARLACGEVVPPWETIRIRDDGSEMQLEIRMSPIHDASGYMVGCSGLLRDISERKRLEQAQEDFLAMASHDLRSPITVLLGRAQLMRRRKTFDESSIQTIITQARRIERLTADLQQVVHMESGKFELERTDVDLSKIAHAAIERILLDAKDISFSLSAPDNPVIGCWDPHRLNQVLDNLLVNSVKYSPDGGDVAIQITTDETIATLRITDHGSGISPDDKKQLFGRFYRSRESRQTAGLGLGLYITRMLLEAHGGSIDVCSTLGEGSTFTLRLPLATPDD